MNTKTITLLLLILVSSLSAQNRIENELLIQLKANTSSYSFFNSIYSQRGIHDSPYQEVTVSAHWQVYKLIISPDETNVAILLEKLKAHDDVIAAGYNFRLEPRTKTPNDSLYDEQWGLEAIHVSDVWECTTGGLTALGDTIVVANLEGSDAFHDDLLENIWRNHSEIPNNGIDDDSNGYIDDYFGVSITNNGDNHFQSGHGTQVTGIIGARGNNGIGITGINWNIKVMLVSSDSLRFDEIIKGYQYVYDMRKLYNDSYGVEGAYVVSTNASFGRQGMIDSNVFFSLWCDMYDDLGEEGILSAGATSNSNIDIDEVGDMPTSCPSDYLVAVTDINRSNELKGGYSSINVDLGAPGGNITATSPSNEYRSIGGTSSATPHVSGGIALLHSAPCEEWAQFAKDEPAEAALVIKSFLLDGVTPLSVLRGKTVSGGLLNLKGSMDLIQNYCGSKTGRLKFISLRPNPVAISLSVEFQTSEITPYKVRVYNSIGQAVHYEEFTPVKFEVKKFEVDVSQYAAGVYFISIENNSNIVGESFIVYR